MIFYLRHRPKKAAGPKGKWTGCLPMKLDTSTKHLQILA